MGKKPITMSFKRSYKRGENGMAEIRAIAKEFGLTVQEVERSIHAYASLNKKV